MRRSTRQSQGFTIIELLIVIGIIAILASILLPVLGSARNRARAVSCANNERQIFTAMVSFAADHDGYLPVPAGVGSTASSAEGPHDIWALDNNYAAGGGVLDFKVGTLWPYLSDSVPTRSQAVLCPADSHEVSSHGGIKTFDRNFSYSFNANLIPAGHTFGTNTSMRLTDITHPAARILIYEEVGPNDEFCFGGTNLDDLPSGRHGTARAYAQQGISSVGNQVWLTEGQANFCFFDGHVAMLSPQTIMTDVQHTPSMYQPLKE